MAMELFTSPLLWNGVLKVFSSSRQSSCRVAMLGESEDGRLATALASLDERSEFVSMVKMQQLVRCTCLEVMGAAPSQIESYRKEVQELTSLVHGYLSEVKELRQQQQQPPPPPSCGSDWAPSSPSTASITAASVPGSPIALTTLEPTFDVALTTAWYEHKPLPPFAVRVQLPSGEDYPRDGELILRASVLNGRGHPEEQRVSGQGDLLAGERNAVVRSGIATWDSLRIGEPSSKHYGSFTVVITATVAPDGFALAELRSAPLTVQVGRMWSKRRKSEGELAASDPISQIPGVGARYVARLQLHGVSTIGQFAAMASTTDGRESLCKLCKGDNPRNSLNAAKLQAMIDTATKVAFSDRDGGDGSATAEGGSARGGGSKRSRTAAGAPLTISASAAAGCVAPPELGDLEPSFSMEELILLASDSDVSEAMGSTTASSPSPTSTTSSLECGASTW